MKDECVRSRSAINDAEVWVVECQDVGAVRFPSSFCVFPFLLDNRFFFTRPSHASVVAIVPIVGYCEVTMSFRQQLCPWTPFHHRDYA
jgi:hypothetical protein